MNQSNVSSHNNEDNITMKIESRDSKRVMNNLLTEIFERKSLSKLSKSNIEDSKNCFSQNLQKNSKSNKFEEEKVIDDQDINKSKSSLRNYNNNTQASSNNDDALCNRFKRNKKGNNLTSLDESNQTLEQLDNSKQDCNIPNRDDGDERTNNIGINSSSNNDKSNLYKKKINLNTNNRLYTSIANDNDKENKSIKQLNNKFINLKIESVTSSEIVFVGERKERRSSLTFANNPNNEESHCCKNNCLVF